MIKMLMMTLSNMININFTKLNHPVSMMMFIIIQTIITGLIMGTMMESFWLSYILFLTFLGGMLVLFIYITSISSNELFKMKSMNSMILIIFMIITSIILMIMDKMLFMDLVKNTETMNINNSINFQEMTLSLEKRYNKPMFTITMMMMVYLFLTLVAVVKIININQGPIRKMS
uniref:NADH-ubiquinone oxidoreductase chain 6 n=1 Tax=Pseudoeoscyllina brevipennisoides TaxID=2708007 RepID=A0A6G6A6U5_9ORTH|nr:NADH dehydrogenase subunit 6 [Pseudoeoscyllina brevipennisoides]QID03574.1 NADH dehydrogenase subunit 6 [Pseudoeoscyllina brevipennisoides]